MQPSVEFGGIKFDSCGISLPSKGLYQVTYGVAIDACPNGNQTGAARFKLNLGSGEEGCTVPGSTLSVTTSRELATVSVLISTQADNSYLQIQNVSIDSCGKHVPVVLNANGGVNAFINVLKLK